jgi:tellurite resistance protein
MCVLGVANQVVFSVWVVGQLRQGGRHTEATTPTLYMPTIGGCFVSASALLLAAPLFIGANPVVHWIALRSIQLAMKEQLSPLT